MGFTRILSAKFRSKKAKELNDDDDTTTTNHSKTTSSTLLRSVSLGSGFMPSSGTITPPLTPIDDDDDEELAVQTNKGLTATTTKLPNRSVLMRVCGNTSRDMRMPHDFSDSAVCVSL